MLLNNNILLKSKIGSTIVLLILLCIKSKSQTNHVINPSFEDTVICPLTTGQIYNSVNWFQPCIIGGTIYNSSSSEYFHSCANSSWIDVPINYFGTQMANTGDAYSGIYLFFQPNYREYIEAKLNSPLIVGRKYCVSMFVSLADSSGYAVSNIGMYFSNDSVLDSGFLTPLSQFTPQVVNPANNIITDKNNWVLISGQFTAQGGEQFITIGNFNNDINTTTSVVGGANFAYYYFDDISVICCDSINGCELLEEPLSIPNVFTPNGDGINDLFEIKGLKKGDKINIYNRWGTKVFYNINEHAYWDGYTTSGEPCSSGTYFYTIDLINGERKSGYVQLVK